jgi:ribosomal protein S27AE
MTQKGDHTWDLVIDYQRCPKCGMINESREGFHYEMGSWKKEIKCERCGDVFIVSDQRKPTFGPLIGNPEPPEVTWGER